MHVYTVSQKTLTILLFNISVKNQLFKKIIFDTRNLEEIIHLRCVNFAPKSEKCHRYIFSIWLAFSCSTSKWQSVYISQGSVAALFRWGGNFACLTYIISSRFCASEIIKISRSLTEIFKSKLWTFLRHHVCCYVGCQYLGTRPLTIITQQSRTMSQLVILCQTTADLDVPQRPTIATTTRLRHIAVQLAETNNNPPSCAECDQFVLLEASHYPAIITPSLGSVAEPGSTLGSCAIVMVYWVNDTDRQILKI